MQILQLILQENQNVLSLILHLHRVDINHQHTNNKKLKLFWNPVAGKLI